MITFSIQISFDDPRHGYIAQPYWPEMAKIIDIQKQSGINRARSQANRRKALEEYLKSTGMTLSDYEQLVAASTREFYTDESGMIIIPRETIEAFLVNTASEIRSASRACDPKQVRTRITPSDFITTKRERDGVWERFAVVQSGTGHKLSNQRGFRRSAYIRDFTADGILTIDEEFVDPKTLHNMIEWGAQMIGIGSSRKMGWGRFRITRFTKMTERVKDGRTTVPA